MKWIWFAVAQLGLVLTWMLVLAAWVGLGAAVRALLGRRAMSRFDLLKNLFVGLGVCIAFLQCWNLVLPISAIAEGIVLVGGWSALAMRRRPLARLAAAMPARKLEMLAGLLVLAWLANRAMAPVSLYDTRMYHINAVRWATEYPAVPGIVNLQRNIAFNNAPHLIGAMLNHGLWRDRTPHVVSGLFLIPIVLAGVCACGELLRRRLGACQVYFALCAPIAIALAIRPEMSGLSSDVPAAVVGVVAVGILIRFFRRFPRHRTEALATLTAILLAGVCCKLSVIGLAGAGIGTAWIACVHARQWIKPTLASAAIALILMGGYMARGVVMSGYPLFPLGIGATHLEWSYPADELAKLQSWIRDHGRGITMDEHRAEPTGRSWISNWLDDSYQHERDRLVAPALLLAAGAVALLAGLKRRNRAWWALVPAAAATMFWVISSPALRFGFAFPWVLGATMLALALPLRRARPAHGARHGLGWMVVIFAIGTSMYGIVFILRADGARLATAMTRLVVKPGPDYGMHPPADAPYKTFTTRFGTVINVPQKGDFTWSAPLPATHIRNPNLKQRDPANLRRGFVIDTTTP